MASQIRQYLEEGRAGKVYDPNQGLYMDPNTGQAFVPTFTNMADSNIQSRVEQKVGPQVGGAQNVQASPYLVSDKPMGGAMPGPQQSQQQEAPPDPRDPWALANAHIKSKGLKNETYQAMFGRDPSTGFHSKEERDSFIKAMKNTRNMLVDRFKFQVLQKDKDAKAEQKKTEASRANIKYSDYKSTLEALKAQQVNDPESWAEQYEGRTPAEVAQEEIDSYLGWQGKGQDDTGMPGRETSAMSVDPTDKQPGAMPTEKQPDKAPTEDGKSFVDLNNSDKAKLMTGIRKYLTEKGITGEEQKEAAKRILREGKFTASDVSKYSPDTSGEAPKFSDSLTQDAYEYGS